MTTDRLGRESSPIGLYSESRGDVFVINDVSLIVPPTDITVQKEDLIHQWRALRSNSSTKLPSGQGQIAVSVVLAFTGPQILDMHRLIVEFRHSPFCYIENRFLRESIVPHWPATQNMAFTMTGLSVAPMQGSSDSWIMQLDLTWFNYTPYVHNWFYRKDWHTVPVRSEAPLSLSVPAEITVGWDWRDGKKIPRHVALPGVVHDPSADVRTWDVVKNEYENRPILSIDDMQRLHRGEVFDLLPMPNRMQPADYVPTPIQSLIYTRFINYLQRDALKTNFDIDVEADLGWDGARSSALHSAFFNAVIEGQQRHTYALHSGPPVSSGEYSQWRALARNWTDRMNFFHGGVTFSFASYNEVRLPREYTELISRAHQASIKNAINDLVGSEEATSEWMIYENEQGEAFGRTLVRRGWTTPNGKYMPVGPVGSSEPYKVNETPLPSMSDGQTGWLTYRGPAAAKRIYGSASAHKPHWGTDFAVPIGAPVFAVDSGRIAKATTGNSSRDGNWFRLEVDGDGWAEGPVRNSLKGEPANDFELSIKQYAPDVEFDSQGNIKNSSQYAFGVGTIVPSLAQAGVFYYVRPSQGGRGLRIDHGGGEFSSYVHLSKIEVAINEEVEAGQLIGYAGNSGPLKEDFFKKAMDAAQGASKPTQIIPASESYTSDDGEVSVYARGPHLHFEYWEPLDKPGNRDPKEPSDGLTREYSYWYPGHVPVDPIPSIKLAVSGKSFIEIDPAALKPDEEDVRAAIEDELGEDVAQDLIDTLTNMWDDGWMYYDYDPNIPNVWWKQFNLNIRRSSPEKLSEGRFIGSPVVLTAVAGGLRHVVANIPILGHEFPTQQHLGSIEPFYSFEFCSLDNVGQGVEHLAGLPREAQLLLGMRSMLHANARNFRPIVDSWAASGDSFITRLLGSYQVNDVMYKQGDGVIEEPFQSRRDGDGRKSVVEEVQLLRRLVNTRGTSMTMKGHPGLTCHTLEFQETNPYLEETITATAPSMDEVEGSTKKILKALRDLNFKTEYRDQLLSILVAQLSGGQTALPEESDYGRFELDEVGKAGLDSIEGLALYKAGDQDWIVYGNDNPEITRILQSLGETPRSFYGTNAMGIPATFLGDPSSYGTQSTTTGLNPALGTVVGHLAGPIAGKVAQQIVNSPSTQTKTTANIYRYNISSILKSSQELQIAGEIPLQKILDYWIILDETIVSAEMLLAEDQLQVESGGRVEPGGYSEQSVSDELYELEVRPSMFKYFQEWMRIIGEAQRVYYEQPFPITRPTSDTSAGSLLRPPLGLAGQLLENNTNWIAWNDSLDREERARINLMNVPTIVTYLEAVGKGTEKTFSAGWAAATTLTATGHAGHQAMTEALGQDPSQIEGIFTSFLTEQYDLTASQVAKWYMHHIPLKTLAVSEIAKSYFTENIFGEFLSTLEDDGGSPVFGNAIDSLKTTVSSGGYFIPAWSIAALPSFLVVDPATRADSADEFVVEGSTPERNRNGKIAVPVARLGESTLKNFFIGRTRGIYPWGSPFIWEVNAGSEKAKLAFFKRMLARYADDIRSDISFLRAFGLEDLSRLNRKATIRGGPAYPDMDLPFHPYYGEQANTPPDFYMWNIYDDGGAHDEAQLERMYESMNDIVQNCYGSMKRLEKGEDYQPSKDKLILEPGTDDPVILPQFFQAEGTDGGGVHDRGQTAFPYAPHPDSSKDVKDYFEDMGNRADATLKRADSKVGKGSGTDADANTKPIENKSALSREKLAELQKLKVDDVRISLTEGYNGWGGGVQYPRRMPKEKYDELKNMLGGITQMFGSRAGYIDQEDLPPSVHQGVKGTVIERSTNPTHEFNADALKRLARESSRDIISQKRTVRRAYPTFKLFFVEEDEFENRLLNFDDFHSYNAVTSFTVVQNRKMPADSAVITLLNVAGTLDGTKRDAIVDLDYFGPEGPKANIPGGSKGGNPVTAGSAMDQPFGAVVLRPGLNVQLRVGYSNDPDELEVLMNGRIVDVQWNTGGDRAEIMVQSFGAELVQAFKGSSHNKEQPTYATTHQLLGAMMLEPELLHFGRWEFGKTFQVGEGKDARLDFNDYSRDGFLGRFQNSSKALKWMLDHPVITSALVLAGPAVLSRAPGAGRLFRRLASLGGRARWSTRVLGRLGLTGSGIGTKGWTRALVQQASRRNPAGTYAAGRGLVTGADVTSALSGRASQMKVISNYLYRVGEKNAPGMGTQLIRDSRRILIEASQEAAGKAPGKAAAIMAKAETDILNLGVKGRWMTNPAELAFDYDTLVNIGFKPIRNVWSGFTTKVPMAIGAFAVAAGSVDLIESLTTEYMGPQVDRVKAYFRSKQVSLLLSPQDDNLFPPHPKDYIETVEDGWAGTLKSLRDWTIKTGVSAFTQDDELGYTAARWAAGYDPFDKRVPVDLCEFYLTGQTIWDVFHEMSLRHPGWIYGIRPYGKEFRYTMFFGVPSQRFWARPANPAFVARANDLARLLESSGNDPDITAEEYQRLYGQEFADSFSVEEIQDTILESAAFEAATAGMRLSSLDNKSFFVREAAAGQGSYVKTGVTTSDDGTSRFADIYNVDPVVAKGDLPLEESDFYKTVANNLLSSRAIKEYMSALSLRFEPFRRYHSVTSDHDLVWNGLISSEQATYNAVDVTYFGDDIKDGPAGSELFKAHAFIPDHRLRVLPLEPSFNVRGYQMAMRYGMGALLHTMRDMYRGEIITLGNPRIRPWDIGILADSYNDMVGPFEVEQVVHSFSHETGYITEIKPSAVVIANEASSWPVLEAMKMMTLATKDVQDSFEGLRAQDAGSLLEAVDWLLGYGAGGSEAYMDHLQGRLEGMTPFDPFQSETGSDLPFLNDLDEKTRKEISTVQSTVGAVGVGLLGGTALLSAGAVFKGMPFVIQSLPLVQRGVVAAGASKFIRNAATATAGITVFGGGLALMGASGGVAPSLAWLLGGPVLFLSCLKGDSVLLVPLMKSGHPIVSGLNLSDPSSVWSNFKGDLGRWADDYVSGTRDLAEMWRLYGTHAWRRNNTLTSGGPSRADYIDDLGIAYAELTGVER